ncbi:MAG TPA: ATP-binding protein [Acidobacteriaceae bacterium]|nr:ATP-binding protein [Acidobacteriaceae bacterium]
MTDQIPSARGDSSSSSQAAEHLRLLVETGLLLGREESLEHIVQAALDAGLKLCGASFGAFFYNSIGDDGSPYQLYKVSGVDPSAFSRFPMPRPTAVFAETMVHGRILRSGDITHDPRYGHNEPFRGMPPGHLPVRSYLSVPIMGRSGEILGSMFYGHPEPNVFTIESESLVATVAAQAAVAIENARLHENLTTEIAIADAARQLQRETSERLEQVFDAMADGVALMNRDWVFTYLNRAGLAIIGRDLPVVGRSYTEVFPGSAGEAFRARYAEAMDGRHVEFVDYYAPLDLWVSLRVFPTPEGIAIFFQDVTQQRRAELALAESTRRLRQALDAGALGTWTWDVATDSLDLDERAAELLFSQPHTPIRRSELRRRIVHSDDLPNTPTNLREAVLNGGVYSNEYRAEGPDKTQRWIAARGLATFNGAQEFTGMIGTVQDVTGRKTQEATLRQSEKLAATGRLAATIAHEINNPLEAVTNLIYICKTDPTVPGPIQRLLESADDELARVTQIAQQTLGFYRDTTRPGQIDFSALLHGIVELFSRKLHFKRLACRTYIQPGLRLYGLQGEIRQVFSNLLVNAIDASEDTELVIRARAGVAGDRPGVSCVIADRGIGIPPAVRERLFSPFITSKHSLGTGLGLWVTRGIIEKHGGSIAYRTRTDPPTGTVFRVFLPSEVPNPDVFNSPLQQFLQ